MPSSLWGNGVWYFLLGPVGEELLFRGWAYGLCLKLWGPRSPTLTNPLPLPIWFSTITFSLWHLQNFGHEPAGFVVFQLAYTIFAGLWLGYLRWGSGTMWVPILAHIALNLSANLW